MKIFLNVLLIVGNLFFASTANAEIKTYGSIGKYLMNDFETIHQAIGD